MSLREEINIARTTAMKQKDSAALQVLRLLFSEIKNKEIEMQKELSDEEVMAVVKTQVKRLKDAADDFAAGGRDDLAQQNEVEIKILSTYLPSQMSDDEICAIIASVMEQLGDNKNMGQIMGQVMAKANGAADGNRVRELVQAVLK